MPKTNGTRLTATWQPSEQLGLSITLKYKVTAGQLAWMRDRFVDYFTCEDATRPVKKDWDRAFRNWCDTDAPKAKRTIKQESPIGEVAVAAENLELWRLRLRGWQRNGQWPAFAGPKPNEQGHYIPRAIQEEFGLLKKKEAGPQVAAPASSTVTINAR